MDKLTEITIRQAKPKLKQYKLFDGGGMFLLVHPTQFFTESDSLQVKSPHSCKLHLFNKSV